METTKSYKKYISLYGPHFTKDLCEFAVSMMEGASGRVIPFTKQEIESKLKAQNIILQYNKLEDFVFVANMCKADFLGQAVPNDDRHLCLYIKNTIDDPDGYDGQVFFRWLTDMKKTQTPVDWAEFI